MNFDWLLNLFKAPNVQTQFVPYPKQLNNVPITGLPTYKDVGPTYNNPSMGSQQILGSSASNVSNKTPVVEQSTGGFQGGSGGSGGSGTGNGTPSGDNGLTAEQMLAQSRYNNNVAAADSIWNQGKSIFDTLIKSINDFRDRAQTGFTNAGQEITNTASDILGTNARTGQELQGQSRALGRAMGLGDSSKFNQQNKILSNLASTQGKAMATRGENERANQMNLDTNLATAEANTGNANSYLQGLTGQVADLKNQTATTYGGDLDSIIQYQRQLSALNAGTPGTVAPNFSAGANYLNPSLAPTSTGTTADQNTGTNLANPVDTQSILKRLLAGAYSPYMSSNA